MWEDGQDVVQALQQISAQWSPWAALLLADGEARLLSQGAAAEGMEDLSKLVDQGHCAQGIFSHWDKHYLQLSGQVEVHGKALLLSAAYDITPIYETRQQQQSAYGKIFLVLLAVCAGLSYSAAWVLTRPLDKLSKTAQKLADGDLSCRADIHTQDELGALAREFDAMAQRQEENFAALKATMEGQDRFIGSFTHELKTPMTSILGCADLLRRGTLSPAEQASAADYIFSEGKRLERLSLKLLDLYLAEHQALPLVPASPAGILQDLTNHLSPGLAGQGISLSAQGEEGLCLLEPDLFRSLLLNLIDNSRKAMEAGGSILATVTMTGQGCVLTVQDDGQGMPPEVLEHLTEAFIGWINPAPGPRGRRAGAGPVRKKSPLCTKGRSPLKAPRAGAPPSPFSWKEAAHEAVSYPLPGSDHLPAGGRGLFLPWAVSAWQDKDLGSQIQQYEAAPHSTGRPDRSPEAGRPGLQQGLPEAGQPTAVGLSSSASCPKRAGGHG